MTIGVARDIEPFSYVDGSGNVVGFEADLAREFAKRWFGDAFALDLAPISAAEADRRLGSGDVDMVIASLVHDQDSDASMDFSQTYYLSRQDLIVPRSAEIAGLQDLQNVTIAVVQGSTMLDTLLDEAQRAGIKLGFRQFPEYRFALDALKAGEVVALAGDHHVLAHVVDENDGLELADLDYGQAPFAIGLAQGDSHLRELVDFTLQDMKTDGVYDELYRRWFPDAEPYDLEVSEGAWPYAFAALPVEVGQPDPSTIQRILARRKDLGRCAD